MTTPYIGEIRMFAGNFAPADWALCNGETLLISEYSSLFYLIGTTYGGDGMNTFQLPDLRGRLPMHQGNGFVMAEQDGVETVTLTENQIPAHTHSLQASTDTATENSPEGHALASPPDIDIYRANAPSVQLATAVATTGTNTPHNNLQPYLCINFIISLTGDFPYQV